jgi:bacterioferritin-associated ferredoxin
MIICSCNVISDHAIRDVVTSTEMALCSTAQVYDCLGCVVQCGLCSRSVKNILDERRAGCIAQASRAADARQHRPRAGGSQDHEPSICLKASRALRNASMPDGTPQDLLDLVPEVATQIRRREMPSLGPGGGEKHVTAD